MNKELPFISVIVPTFNQPHYLKTCIKSLLKQTYPQEKFEIIVIDDYSAIEAKDVLEELGCSAEKLTVVRNDKNLGSGASRQRGYEIARGELLASTDDDCSYHEAWLYELFKHMDGYAGVGGCVGVLEEYTFFQKIFAIQSNLGHARIEGKNVVSIPGSNALYRRSVIEMAGGYSCDRTIAEDRELNIRITENGFSLGLVETAIAYPVPKENFFKYFAWKYRVGDHCHQLVFKSPGSYPEDMRSMLRSLPYNPLAMLTFPCNVIRIIWNFLTFFPSALILGSICFMRMMRLKETILMKLVRSTCVGWAVRTLDRQITDIGVAFAELRRLIKCLLPPKAQAQQPIKR